MEAERAESMLSEGRLQEASDAFKQASATASSLLAKLHFHERALVANNEHATSDERAKMHQYLDDIKACERAQIKDAKQQKSVRIGYREYKGYVLLSEGGAHKGDLILVEDALLVAPNGSPQRECSGDKWKAFLEELQEHFGRDSVDDMRALGMKMDLPEYEWLGPLAFWLLDEATQQKILELHAPDMSDDRVRERFAYLDPSSEHFVADSTLKQCCFASENEIDTFRTVARIFDNNSLACNSRQDELCLFQTFCRLSHSCEPNCARSSFEKDDGANSEGPKHTQALRALQDIESGEELTISYLSDSELLECTYLRHGFLSKTKFFECNCERCAKELDTSRTFNCPSCGSSGSIVGKAAKAEGHEPCTSCGTSLGDQWSTFESNEEQIYDNVSRAEAVAEELPGSTLQQLLQMEGAAALAKAKHFLSGRVHEVTMRRLVAASEAEEALSHLQVSIDCQEHIRPDAVMLKKAWALENKGDLTQSAQVADMPKYTALNLYQASESLLLTLVGPQNQSVREVQHEKAALTGVRLTGEQRIS